MEILINLIDDMLRAITLNCKSSIEEANKLGPRKEYANIIANLDTAIFWFNEKKINEKLEELNKDMDI